MDCITCGCELIGNKIVSNAAICSEYHMICIKCNQNCMRICPLCESEALYCDILPFDDNSITLLVDLQRQNAEMLQSTHDAINRETDVLSAEEEVIEEHVQDDEEEADAAKSCTDVEETQSSAEEKHNYKQMFSGADSIVVGKTRIEKQHAEQKPAAATTVDSEDDASEISSLTSSDSNDDLCDSNINLQESSVYSDLFKVFIDNPIKPSKLQLKLKNRSFITQLKLLYADEFAGMTEKQLPENSDCEYDEGNTQRKVSTLDLSTLSETSKSSAATVCMDVNGVSKYIPQRTYSYQYDRAQECRKGAGTVSAFNEVYNDGERLFIWRAVKKGEFTYNSLFVKKAPKGDKRMQAVFQILREHASIKRGEEAKSFYFNDSDSEGN